MKLKVVAGFVLLLAACPRIIVDEDAGTGGSGGSGGVGGSNAEMGGGGGGAGGCACTGGGQSAGGGGQPNPQGIELVLEQPKPDAGWIRAYYGPGGNYATSYDQDCSTDCLSSIADRYFTAMLRVDGFVSRGAWADGSKLSRTFQLVFDTSGVTYAKLDVSFEEHNYLFLTSGTYAPGVLGDGAGNLTVADSICNQEAVQRGFGGHYIAWLSTQAHSAVSRIPPGVRGWVSVVHGTHGNLYSSDDLLQPVFDQAGDGWVLYPVLGSQDVPVATGTTGWGTAAANCNDWTSSDPALTYVVGSSALGSPGFTDNGVAKCDQPANLYCLQIDHTAPIQTPVETVNDIAFVTSGTYPSGGGLAGFDQACNAEAAAASLPGTYRALLATLSTPAWQRLTTAYESHARVDGVLIGNLEWSTTVSDYAAGSDVALQLTADGRVLLPANPNRPSSPKILSGDDRVWLGAMSDGTTGATCSDWFSTSGEGQITRATSGKWTAETASCSEQLHLFCLQIQ